MKFIFDFDEVLFDTKKLREIIVSKLSRHSISGDIIEEYFKKERWNQFSLKKMLVHFSVTEDLYEEIMCECRNLKNKELLEMVQGIGKQNCFILSYGDKEFQLDKINRLNIRNLFSEIFINETGNKNELIEKLCAKYKNEVVVFVDDKPKHFEDLDMEKCPNLKTILFDEHGLEKLRKVI